MSGVVCPPSIEKGLKIMSDQKCDLVSGGKFFELYGRTILSEGVAPIPTALFRYQKALGLTFQEVCFICHLLSYRWTTRDPHPSIEKLSELTGVSAKTLHGYKNSLVGKGKMKFNNRFDKKGGQMSNEYDLTPLFIEIEQIIREKKPDILQGPEDVCCTELDTGCEEITLGGMKKLHRGVLPAGEGCEEITCPPITTYSQGGITGSSHELDNIQSDKENKELLISSLRSDISNRSVVLRASPAAVVPFGNKSEDDIPTSRELIAELVREYRSLEGVVGSKGDYAFIGGLYNSYGYEEVLCAIVKLGMAMVVQQIEKPLLYLKGILEPIAAREVWKRTRGTGKGISERKDCDKRKELIKKLYFYNFNGE